jgi:hypothetical protein
MTNAERSLKEIAVFVGRHSRHGPVEVNLDIVPDVIRFDCSDHNCPCNLQVLYEKEEHDDNPRG